MQHRDAGSDKIRALAVLRAIRLLRRHGARLHEEGLASGGGGGGQEGG